MYMASPIEGVRHVTEGYVSLHVSPDEARLKTQAPAVESGYGEAGPLESGSSKVELQFGVGVRANFAVQVDLFVLRGYPFHGWLLGENFRQRFNNSTADRGGEWGIVVFCGASLSGQVRVVASEGPPRKVAATNKLDASGVVDCAQYRRDLVVIRTAADALWARYQWHFAIFALPERRRTDEEICRCAFVITCG
jgi:hypothetical protein